MKTGSWPLHVWLWNLSLVLSGGRINGERVQKWFGGKLCEFEKINAIPPQILIGCFIILFDLDVVYEKGGCNTICVTGSKTLFIVPLTGNTCETRAQKRRCCCFWATKVTAISPNRNRHQNRLQQESAKKFIHISLGELNKADVLSVFPWCLFDFLYNLPVAATWILHFLVANDFGGDFGLEKSQLLLLLKNNNSDVFGPLFRMYFQSEARWKVFWSLSHKSYYNPLFRKPRPNQTKLWNSLLKFVVELRLFFSKFTQFAPKPLLHPFSIDTTSWQHKR